MTTVLLTRHEDINLPAVSPDPELNAVGIERAEALAHAVGAARADAVFTSSFLRTKQIAAPLATRIRVQPRQVLPPAKFARQVRAGALGEVVLVVGHSNTVLEMIAEFGAAPIRPRRREGTVRIRWPRRGPAEELQIERYVSGQRDGRAADAAYQAMPIKQPAA
ncbi:phosphoglycerate mutase family protein [Rhodococcus sp. MTM3W5.2]|uniref:phosphoglycerate mutase family protein n=1 Tax=Rhodococcus sp. MTM3W5.2 TaxID=1805827 RepID=UPI00097C4D96|nr:phosphoglycerate mutase family protein [Rhodococcus sp. MTM3W5.2]